MTTNLKVDEGLALPCVEACVELVRGLVSRPLAVNRYPLGGCGEGVDGAGLAAVFELVYPSWLSARSEVGHSLLIT